MTGPNLLAVVQYPTTRLLAAKYTSFSTRPLSTSWASRFAYICSSVQRVLHPFYIY